MRSWRAARRHGRRVRVRTEGGSMTKWDEWSYGECYSKCFSWGHQNTTEALEKYKLTVKEAIGDCRIRFEWHDADQPSERARCIRGAFHRIATEGRDEGKCSNHFKARFRVVRGLRAKP